MPLRIRYEPNLQVGLEDHCTAVLIERPDTGEVIVTDGHGHEAFTLFEASQVGHCWVFAKNRLPLYARAIAFYNKRKNICSTDAASGVIV